MYTRFPVFRPYRPICTNGYVDNVQPRPFTEILTRDGYTRLLITVTVNAESCTRLSRSVRSRRIRDTNLMFLFLSKVFL